MYFLSFGTVIIQYTNIEMVTKLIMPQQGCPLKGKKSYMKTGILPGRTSKEILTDVHPVRCLKQ